MMSDPLSDIFRDIASNAFKELTPQTITTLLKIAPENLARALPEENARYKLFYEIAFQKNAEVFKSLLTRFKNDAVVLRAMNDGFKRDEKWSHDNRGNSDSWGPEPDFRDLEKKRAALQEVVIDLLAERGQANEQPPVSNNQPPSQNGSSDGKNPPKRPRFQVKPR